MAEVLESTRSNMRSEGDDFDSDDYLQAYWGRLEDLRERVASLTAQLQVTYRDLSEEITRSFGLAERVYRAVCADLAVDIGRRDDNLLSLLEQLIDDIRAVCEGAEILIARSSR